MSTRIGAPVLTVDAGKMQGIDTRNVENLFGMWTVFSRCADYMEEGRRLENLSWRIWNRETFCCETQPQFTTSPSMMDFRRTHSGPRDIPELSSSVESVASDDAEGIEHHRSSHSLPLNIARVYTSKSSMDSHSSSRGKERPITSLGLKKMVASIKEKRSLGPLSPSIVEAVPTFYPLEAHRSKPIETDEMARRASDCSEASTAPMSSLESNCEAMKNSGSDTSADLITSHSVVHGFSPGQISSFRSHSHLAPSPMPVKSSLHSKADFAKQKGGGFMLGGSSGEDESSFEESRSRHQAAQTSSLTAGLKKPATDKKQTSFKDEVESRTINNRSHQDEDVFESDDEEDVSESAIEDEEDESDWEDSATDSGGSSINERQMFQRVDSKANLTSRRSLLTTLMHQPDRAAALAEMAARSSKSSPALHRRSRTSSPNGPSVATTPEYESLLTTDPRVPRSRPIIVTTSNTHPPALSPRTTRRNMLATELTESLRKHLLWERQQKNTTANAVLKRRHTAHDMANLKQFPHQVVSGNTSKNNSWNHQYFDHGLGEYHQKGW